MKETSGFTPPVVASRVFGYMGVTLYETVRPGMTDYETLAGQLSVFRRATPAQSSGPTIICLRLPILALASITRHLFSMTPPERLGSPSMRLRNDSPASSLPSGHGDLWTFGGMEPDDGRRHLHLVDDRWGPEGYARNFPTDYTPPATRAVR